MSMPIAPHLTDFKGFPLHSWYSDEARFTERYPLLQSALDVDVAVIGGGFTGLSSALTLAEKGLSVALLEGALIGYGASGRNGGQVLHGFAAPQSQLRKQLGESMARQCWELSLAGVDLLAERITQHKIDCHLHWGYLTTASTPHQIAQLQGWQQQLADYGHNDTQWLDEAELAQHIHSPAYRAGLYDRRCGHIQPLRYAQGLARAASQLGVNIFEASPAVALEETAHAVTIRTARGLIRAGTAILACNVDIGRLRPTLRRRFVPVASHIIATEPLGQEHARQLLPGNAAVCDSNHLLDYFRLTPDHRLLFGGRAHRPERHESFVIQERQRKLGSIFPSLASCKIDYSWHGYIDIGLNKLPQLGREGQRVYYAQGFAGHGVALSGLAGWLIANAITGTSKDFDLLAALPESRLPLPLALQNSLVRLATLYYRLRDKLGR